MRSFCNFCNLKKVVHSLLRKVVLKKYLVNFSKASIVEFSYNIVNDRCWGDWPTTLPIGDFAKNIFWGVSWILSQCHFCNTYEYLVLVGCFENSSVLFLKRSIHPLVFWTKFQWLLGNYLRRNAVYITLQGILQLYYAGKWTSAQYFPGSIATFQRWWRWWWWIVFVVWLTDERRSALFRAGTIVRDPHHREAPTRREQCQA